ncbi:hypothetical protein FCV25MIE_14901 [Fagus crenata]
MYVSMVKKGGRGKGRGCPPKSSLLPKLNESLSSLITQDIFWADDAKCFYGNQERGLPRVGGNNGITDCEQVLVDPDVGLLGDAAINGELAKAQTNLGIGVAVNLGHLPFCSIKHGSDLVLSKQVADKFNKILNSSMEFSVQRIPTKTFSSELCEASMN